MAYLWIFVVIATTTTVTLASSPDQFLNTSQLIIKYGYPAETHQVTTQDGYILTLFRIPHSPKCPPTPSNKPVAVVQHGLLSSSTDFIILGPNKSLGYMMADNCFDVWLPNSRGNTYSREHVNLSTNSYKYWDFSFHEMGIYDMPATIDYILNKTGQSDLFYIGTSMGGTMFFVLTSMKPEYNQKIRLMVGLAPSAFMAHSKTALKTFQLNNKFVLNLLTSVKIKEIMPSGILMHFVAEDLCSQEYVREICTQVLFSLCGSDEKQLNQTMLPVLLSHTPAGSSWKTFLHYLQLMISASGKFVQYDYGKFNMARYKQPSPPEYNLKAVTAPVALFYGQNDPFADPDDLMTLSRKLPNVVQIYRVPWNMFSHMDFVWANDVKTLVNDQVISVVKNFSDIINN